MRGLRLNGAGMCEAQERNTRAVFEIEMMAGKWVIDLGRIKRILTGADCHHEDPQGSSPS